MKSSPSKHVTTSLEVNTTILEWVQATEEFHRYHRRIDAILQDRNCNRYVDSTVTPSASKSARIRSLDKLRQHMNKVLEVLMADMNSSSHGSQYASNYSTLSRVGRLVTHARLLKDINLKISQELLLFNDTQA